MSNPEQRLADKGLSIPEVAKPVAAYVPAVRTGNYVMTSGQLPLRDGQLLHTGKVGGGVSEEEAFECAQQCVLNALAAVEAEIGDLSAMSGWSRSWCSWPRPRISPAQPQVANGASELLGEVFGGRGPARPQAVGVAVLPLDAPVEVELIVEVS